MNNSETGNGVLVEPAPNLFLSCRENRSLRNHIACVACVPFDYRDEYVKMIYSNSMSVSLNLETDVGDPVGTCRARAGQFLRPAETVFTFAALARSLNSILLEADAPKLIDFFLTRCRGFWRSMYSGVSTTICSSFVICWLNAVILCAYGIIWNPWDIGCSKKSSTSTITFSEMRAPGNEQN